jgi:hypothetical protein
MVEVGDELEPAHRSAPAAEQVAGHVGAELVDEFAAHARAVRRRGLVVPGPMLTAFIEQFLRRALPGWRLERLGTTFRVPTIAGTPLVLRGAVTEHHEMADGERLVCDVVIEHAGEGDRAVTGIATLGRARSA